MSICLSILDAAIAHALLDIHSDSLSCLRATSQSGQFLLLRSRVSLYRSQRTLLTSVGDYSGLSACNEEILVHYIDQVLENTCYNLPAASEPYGSWKFTPTMIGEETATVRPLRPCFWWV